MKALVVLCTGLALLTAADVAAPGSAAAQSSGRACFFASSVRGFRPVDDHTVVARVSGDDLYALEFAAPCTDVDWARRATLHSRTGRQICVGSRNVAEVFVPARGGARHRMPARGCRVANVRRLSPAEIAALQPGARP